MPVRALETLELERKWPIATMLTPADVGLDGPPEIYRDLGLRTLARVSEREGLLRLLTELALSAEGPQRSEVERDLIRAMAFPVELEGRLLGAIGPRSRLLSPLALRWLIAEVVAAAPWPGGIPPGGGPFGGILAEAFFPWEAWSSEPTLPEILRAVFFVQADFNPRGLQAFDPLPDIAASSFGLVADHLVPLLRLRRSAMMWVKPPDHPRLARIDLAGIRAQVEEELGVPIQDVLGFTAGLVFLFESLRTVADSQSAASVAAKLYSPEAERALIEWISTDLDQLGEGIRDEMRPDGDYRGWGSAPKGTPRAMTDRPLIRFSDGRALPWSLNALAARAADLPRFVLVSTGTHTDRDARSVVGYLFEAYCVDELRRLPRGSVQLLMEDELRKRLPGSKLADAVVLEAQQATVLEFFSGSRPYKLSVGDEHTIATTIERYRKKTDQTRAVSDRFSDVAPNRWLVEDVARLLVVDDPLPNNPMLQAEVGGDGPICSADEYDLLLATTRRGWSITSIIRGWRSRAPELPLATHLQRQLVSRSDDLLDLASEWLGSLVFAPDGADPAGTSREAA